MGMFDTIHCSYDLGAGFYNRDLQTKDLECTMAEYWLCPQGYLYELDYAGTSDFIELMPGDDGYNDTALWTNFRLISNGNRGRIKPHRITDYVEVYPANWTAHYAAFPRLRIHFIDGKLNGIV